MSCLSTDLTEVNDIHTCARSHQAQLTPEAADKFLRNQCLSEPLRAAGQHLVREPLCSNRTMIENQAVVQRAPPPLPYFSDFALPSYKF